MGGKHFGGIVSTANEEASLYTVPVGKSISFTVNAANNNNVEAKVWIWVGGYLIEPGVTLPAYAPLERTAMIAVADMEIRVKASLDGVTFTAYGIEE